MLSVAVLSKIHTFKKFNNKFLKSSLKSCMQVFNMDDFIATESINTNLSYLSRYGYHIVSRNTDMITPKTNTIFFLKTALRKCASE